MASDVTLNVELNALSRAETGDANSGGGMHEGGFNGGGRPEDNNENGGNMHNATNASLNQKTSFKQKFVLNDGSNS